MKTRKAAKHRVPKRGRTAAEAKRPTPLAARNGAPPIKVFGKDDEQRVGLDHPEPAVGYGLLMTAVGTNEVYFLHGLFRSTRQCKRAE
jgi:hypothetical protein